eukprot:CAMPEP_0184857158 /NCGR_PEP_ID=MMETSP0580-20130426/2320_1 /TAXON_ID=1118495 /ORGANISM="Dactyliosolen fragilissimus" /LENGTH=508 /DNA_ID=CAMNT_0027352589 /DNA_START=6 /DNA_END=1532 /DNA_ORIENTATION=+
MRLFPFGKSQIYKIWRRAKPGVLDPSIVCNYHSLKKGNSGRKKKYSAKDTEDALNSVRLEDRSTLRSLAHHSGIPTTSAWRLVKEKMISRHTSTMKPLLTPANKVARYKYCKSFVRPDGMFHDMMDRVHIDEKWFYLATNKKNFYLLPDENPPLRCTKSKRFITKVMFMATVARPRWDHNRRCLFDGKIGLWPFVNVEAAKRNSVNRPKGTLETKAMTSVRKEHTKEILLEYIIPEIKRRWPLRHKNKIVIQQDNASPHPAEDDPDLVAAMTEGDWNICIENQTPNSPDLNVLDLGYFASIQSLQQKKNSRNIDDLIFNVQDSFEELSNESLDNIFLTLMMVMEEVMRDKGGNNFKLRHLSKAKLRKEGRLPLQLVCDNLVLDQEPTLAQDGPTVSAQNIPPVVEITTTTSTAATTEDTVDTSSTDTDTAQSSIAPANDNEIIDLPDGAKKIDDCSTSVLVTCRVCALPVQPVHYCLHCKYVCHVFCGYTDGLEEGFGKPVKCFLCAL